MISKSSSIATFFIALSIIWKMALTQANPDARSINIHNDSGSKVEVYWIHPNTNEAVLQSSPFIYNGATFSLNSFVSHAFEAREIPEKGGKCAGENHTCRIGYFAVNENDEQVIFINSNFEVKHQDNITKAKDSAAELIVDCKEGALHKIKEDGASAEKAIDYLTECIESSVADKMANANEEIAFQAQIRTKMAERFENYTCADFDMPTTEAIDTRHWYSNRRKLKVEVLLDRPAAKVHLVKNFITKEECDAMEVAAKPKLHKATVADGKGGSEFSPNRKAMQAGIKIPWHLEKEQNPLTTISRRVYDYVNHVLGMDIKENGQEDLMSIQYFGRGEEDTEPDRYMPHCDGDCNGMDFKHGNRMATMVMYCDIPEKGGATNFRNAGIHVVPEVGSATFFSYIDPETMKMDDRFTEHSGCPVISGEKKIVTQWVRYGVDDENPWDSYNTLGLKVKNKGDDVVVDNNADNVGDDDDDDQDYYADDDAAAEE